VEGETDVQVVIFFVLCFILYPLLTYGQILLMTVLKHVIAQIYKIILFEQITKLNQMKPNWEQYGNSGEIHTSPACTIESNSNVTS